MQDRTALCNESQETLRQDEKLAKEYIALRRERRLQEQVQSNTLAQCLAQGNAGSIGKQTAPKDSYLLQRMTELRDYVLESSRETSQATRMLFGETLPDPYAEMENDSLEALLADTCQRASNLLSDLRTINSRLGGQRGSIDKPPY